jgi:hypothetical protein
VHSKNPVFCARPMCGTLLGLQRPQLQHLLILCPRFLRASSSLAESLVGRILSYFLARRVQQTERKKSFSVSSKFNRYLQPLGVLIILDASYLKPRSLLQTTIAMKRKAVDNSPEEKKQKRLYLKEVDSIYDSTTKLNLTGWSPQSSLSTHLPQNRTLAQINPSMKTTSVASVEYSVR